MITLNGQRYDITFVGNCDIEEVPGASLGIDAYGLDTLTRKYKGRVDRLAAFLKANRRDRKRPDATYQGLTFASMNFTESGPWAEGEMTFKGTHDGSMPDPLPPTTSLSPETVTLSQYDGAESADFPTVEITYLAPVTTWRYVTRKRPTVPQRRGQLAGSQEIQYISRRGGAGDLSIFAGGNLGTPLDIDTKQAGQYNGVAMTVTKAFNVTPAGIYFECEESNMRTIFPFDLANINWTVSLSP
jgi:hypothetical protein